MVASREIIEKDRSESHNSWRYAFPHQLLEMLFELAKGFKKRIWGVEGLRASLWGEMLENSRREPQNRCPTIPEVEKVSIEILKIILNHFKMHSKLMRIEAWILLGRCKDDEKCYWGAGSSRTLRPWI